VGIGLRALLYRLILHMDGVAAIENGVRLRFASHIRLGRGVYLDNGVYLHACPNGIEIGEGTFLVHHAELHVYNFRNIPHSGIRIGCDSLIGEYNVIRGQGGVTIGDRVYFAPLAQVLAPKMGGRADRYHDSHRRCSGKLSDDTGLFSLNHGACCPSPQRVNRVCRLRVC
jgi:acetyltransferase-like isoleucine patch superfamily enzyme